ncbi:hypothetical protein OH76DRAFT_1489904 [Lentinus brumalis]|uniref:Uncharacterized protein n=1 Tax=Lentinus brumalis TaxID=2498619 RepID=A0A371CKW3_9APHY|nr:hypothetical protein OH76DRAFT_1489904 [Polyporus brumalis]
MFGAVAKARLLQPHPDHVLVVRAPSLTAFLYWVRLLDTEAPGLSLPQDFTPRLREVVLAFGTLCVILARRERLAASSNPVSGWVRATRSARPGAVTPEEIAVLVEWARRYNPEWSILLNEVLDRQSVDNINYHALAMTQTAGGMYRRRSLESAGPILRTSMMLEPTYRLPDRVFETGSTLSDSDGVPELVMLDSEDESE